MDKILNATLEEYKLLRHWESLINLKNIPLDLKSSIDLETSNHEYVWTMVEHLLVYMDKDDLLNKSKDVLNQSEYDDFSRTVEMIASMV